MKLHSFTPGGITTRLGKARVGETGRPEVVVHITATEEEIAERVLRILLRRQQRNGGAPLL